MTSLRKRQALMLMLMCELDNEEQDKKRKKRVWVKKRNSFRRMGLLNEIVENNTDDFKNYLRMDDTQFELLLNLVSPIITKKNTVMRQAVPARERLIVTLRFLATGQSFADLKYSTISRQLLYKIIPETCAAIIKVLRKDYMAFPKEPQEWLQIASDFEKQWHFPNCGGVVEGKHIRISGPAKSDSHYLNYKGYHSIILMAIVNANSDFVMVNAGTNGRASGAEVLENTTFNKRLLNNELNLPNSQDCEEALNFVFIGDDAFPLHPNFLTPYSKKYLDYPRKIYNYRLSRARRVIENAFCILTDRFKIFHTAINLQQDKIEKVIIACCILHNFLRKTYRISCSSTMTEKEGIEAAEIIPDDLGQHGIHLDSLDTDCRRNSTEAAKEARNKYAEYFIGPGKVSWQDSMIK